jgi:DNA-binding IclR family transcriptional regulator
MALIEYFNQRRAPASIKNICEALNVPQSSASMLVKCLTDLGYLTRIEGTRTYAPGTRSAFISDWALERLGHSNPLRDVAEDLANDLGETVVIGTQNGPYVQYLHVASARDPDSISTRVGQMVLMACTASGRSLLSRLDDQRIVGIARRNNAEAPPHARVKEQQLLSTIHAEKSRGFFESRGGLIHGISNISVPLTSQDDQMPLVIGVGGPSDHICEIRDQILLRLGSLRQKQIAAFDVSTQKFAH